MSDDVDEKFKYSAECVSLTFELVASNQAEDSVDYFTVLSLILVEFGPYSPWFGRMSSSLIEQ